MLSGMLKSLARRQQPIHGASTIIINPGLTSPAALPVQRQQPCRNMSSTSSQQETEEKLSPQYVHHVSKIVLEHLQDSRADWTMRQGLHQGLRVKSNGTFVLEFPARKGFDSGRIWTSYDASKRQHWLSVYRQKFNGRFLLKQGQPKTAGFVSKAKRASHNRCAEAQIRSVVDQMIRQLPPKIATTTK